jgi:predicted dehydrogenase
MSDKTIRVGVIGTGMIGARHIQRYATIDGAQIVAIADLDRDKAAGVAEENGIAEVYTDYHELLARDDIDAVDVCLHNQLHRPVSVDAMEAGKDVYCEKPIAATYADGIAMIRAANATGRKLHIQTGTIYAPAVRLAREWVAAGELGEIYYARAYVNLRRSRPFVDGAKTTPPFVRKETAGGGALIDWGIYTIVQALFVMGNPTPVRVSGRVYDKIPMDPARRAESRYDVEEMATGLVHFADGATMDVLAAWALHLNELIGCAVAGPKAGITLPALARGKEAGDAKLFSSLTDPWTEEALDVEGAKARWDKQGVADAYDSPQHHWVRALQGKVELLPSAELALNMILIAEGIYRSHEQNREVDLAEIIEAAG